MGLGLGRTTTGLLGLERRQMMRSRKLVGFLDEDEEGRGFQSVEMVSQQSRVSGWKVLVDLFYVLSYGSLARTIFLLQSPVEEAERHRQRGRRFQIWEVAGD